MRRNLYEPRRSAFHLLRSAADELAEGLTAAVKSGGLVPVFVCMSLKDIGIQEILDGALRYFPSPASKEIKDKEGNERSQ